MVTNHTGKPVGWIRQAPEGATFDEPKKKRRIDSAGWRGVRRCSGACFGDGGCDGRCAPGFIGLLLTWRLSGGGGVVVNFTGD